MFPERKKLGGNLAVFPTQYYVLNIVRGTSLESPNHEMVKHPGSGVRQAYI